MNKILTKIEKTNFFLTILLLPMSFILGSWKMMVSLFLGFLIAGSNYWVLKRSIMSLLQNTPNKSIFLFILGAKYMVLLTFIGFLIIYFDLQMLGLLVGVSTLVLAILWNTVLHGFK